MNSLSDRTEQDEANARQLALDAEIRAEDAVDQDERDNWLRIADEWWSKVHPA
jgi:hypothetical protein